jgi:tetratricopeptide (TPR) repeat protein
MAYNKDKGSGSRGGKPTQQRGRGAGSASGKGSERGSSRNQSGKKKQYSATTRDVERARYEDHKKRRRDLQGAAVNLPNWVIENLERGTPKDRIAPALEALGAASEALSDGNYQAAVRHGNRAKALAPQDSTVRETIGIAAYRLGDWKTALTELRAYRRIAGETTHLPIEMDVLRAQGRNRDVEQAWQELSKRGGHGLVMNEGKVVYASFLLDEDRAPEAWKIVKPGRIEQEPNEGHLRLYFVAARTAAALGDLESARELSNVIVTTDPSFPGWEQLEREIANIR